MPFANVIKTSVIMLCLVEELTELGPYALNSAHEGSKRSSSIDSNVSNDEPIRSNVFGHNEAANFTRPGSDQGPLYLFGNLTR
jgi:hypothetical protein